WWRTCYASNPLYPTTKHVGGVPMSIPAPILFEEHHAMPLHNRFRHLGIARIATNRQRTPPSRCNIHILSSSILLNNTFRAFLKSRSRPSSTATRFPPLPNCMQ
ncbi:hypothetical protein JI435_307840, partial [Parastagonospora nodorum SN15]